MIGILLCLPSLWTLAQGEPPRDMVIHRGATLKIHETEHLKLYYTGDFETRIESLAKRSEEFLIDLEKRWSIKLPPRPIYVSLVRVAPTEKETLAVFEPPWLTAIYSHDYQGVIVRVRPPQSYDLELVSRAIQRQLVRAVIHLFPERELPLFLEEGLARYYSKPRGSQQTYLAVLGFQKAEKLYPFLTDESLSPTKENYYYAGALGREFVAWMWRQNPKSERLFLQEILRGQKWDVALRTAGFPLLEEMIAEFDEEMRPQFELKLLLKTYDFWLIIGSSLGLLIFLGRIVFALRWARLSFAGEELALPKEPSIRIEDLVGPAFGQEPLAVASPSPPSARGVSPRPIARVQYPAEPRARKPAPEPELERSFGEIDADLDKLFGDFGVAETNQEDLELEISPLEQEEAVAIDRDIEDAFADFPFAGLAENAESHNPKASSTNRKLGGNAELERTLSDLDWEFEDR